MRKIIVIACGLIMALAARAAISADASSVSGVSRASVPTAVTPATQRDEIMMRAPELPAVAGGFSHLFWEIVKVEQESASGYETIFEGPLVTPGREKSYLIPFDFNTTAGNVYILPGYRGITEQQCTSGNCAVRTRLLHCMDLNDLAYLVSTDAGHVRIDFVPYGFVKREGPWFFGVTERHQKTLALIFTGESYVIVSRTAESMIWEETSGEKRITFRKRILNVDERIADCASAQ